jgi:hypothetical protein
MAGHRLAVTFAGMAITQAQSFLRSRNGDVKKPPFFIQGAFVRGTRVRQKAIFQPDNEDMGKFQTFATVHRNQRYGVALGFLLLLSLAIQRDLLQKGL